MEKITEAPKNKSIKVTISLSPKTKDIASKYSDILFAGNLSAFMAAAVIHFEKCSSCQYLNESITNNVIETINSQTGNISQINIKK